MWLGSLISWRIMATSRGEITFVFNNLAQKMSDICPFCICQIIMFNPRVMVTELLKNGSSFCIFCWWKQKISHIMGKCLRAPERSYRDFQKMVWLIGFEVTICEISKINLWKNLLNQLKKYENLNFQGLTFCWW